MEISFLDLRKKPGKILDDLEKKESVTLFRRGKPIAKIVPLDSEPTCKVSEHPAFGMWADDEEKVDVDRYVREMRKGRFDDL